MTRHHNKKSFLSQAKYDIQMRARAIEHRRKIREATMYGNAQGKIRRKDTMYRNVQEKIGRKDTMYGNAQGNLIGEDREDAIYGNVQEEMISRSSSGHENLNRLHKFTPEVQKQQNNSNFDTHYQNYCRCCNYSYCNCKAKNHSYFCSVCKFYKCYKGKGGIYRTKSCMYWRKDNNGNFRIFDVRFHQIKLPWE
ncbi:unnamed protein product [Rhizophagus irregularis]|uniref:Uncharacterized protein n=1 Tax=Rhizophagus irregularis TaxID=588596 RepID=A0A916E4F4_9GLOM|nr:unnamed protein product [Rhizophagus irregularis]CAB5359811.1 unnamed protein product [Rhizophagus irregularis]